MATTAPQLPIGLVREILHHLHPLPLQQAPRDTPFVPIHEEAKLVGSLRAIQQCMLVSKAFYHIARPILFSKITLTYQARTVEDDLFCMRLYQDVFLRNPDVAAEVREVEINFISEDSGDNHNPDGSDSDEESEHDHHGHEDGDHGHHHDHSHDKRYLQPQVQLTLEEKRQEAFATSGNHPWTGIVGVLDMITQASALCPSNSSVGIQRLVLKGLIDYDDMYCDLRTLDDPVILSLVGLRTSRTLKSLVMIHIRNPHPALVFGDPVEDQLKSLDVHCGSYALSGQRGLWPRPLVMPESASAQVRRPVGYWEGEPSSDSISKLKERGLLPAVETLYFTHGSFAGCVKSAETTLGCASFQRIRRLRLPADTEEEYNQELHMDFIKGMRSTLEQLEIENERGWKSLSPILSKHTFPKLHHVTHLVHVQAMEPLPVQLQELKTLLTSFRNITPTLHTFSLSLLRIKILIFLKSSQAGVFNRFIGSAQWNQLEKDLEGMSTVEADLITVSSLSNALVLGLLRMDDPESFLPGDLKECPFEREARQLGADGVLNVGTVVESGRRVRWGI